MPVFSGPWAAEFRSAFRRASNPVAKEILADGQITLAEYRMLGDEMVSCLADQGAANGRYSTSGTVGFEEPANGAGPDAVMNFCSAIVDWDSIVDLWLLTRSNPNREDVDSMIAGCVVRMGLRPEGYTGDDYLGDSDLQVWDIGDWDNLDRMSHRACVSDPRTGLSIYQIEADCLVRAGMREPGYTGADFEREYHNGGLPKANPGFPNPEISIMGECYGDPFYAYA
jgi:hypothetical protein